jgi:hypothetical protein
VRRIQLCWHQVIIRSNFSNSQFVGKVEEYSVPSLNTP